MKQVKRILSVLLVLAMVFSMLPANAVAAEAPQATVGSNDATLQGGNSFGSLLVEDINKKQETTEETAEDYQSGYSVSELVIEGNVATVTYDTLETANLVVAIYTEDGLQMVTSGNAVVEPENTTATVTIAGTMPMYFMAAAYLLDTYDMSPLCAAFDTPMYTKDMQELLASTVDDYDADKVLNLDDDETTNFAVYADTTKVIEYVEGYNTVVSADDETATYVIENADSQFTSLAVGDIVAYSYGDNDILIVKVATISVSGTTVTLTGGEVELEEVFAAIKIEAENPSDNVIVDTSTLDDGVTYEGKVTDSVPSKIEVEFSTTLEFSIDKDLVDEAGSKVTLKSKLSLALTIKLKYYKSLLGRKNIEFIVEKEVKMTGEISDKRTFEFPLCVCACPIIPGVVDVTLAPTLEVSVGAKLELEINYTKKIGFTYDSWSFQKFKLINPRGQIELDAAVSGTFSVSIDVKPQVKILTGAASIGLGLPIGVEIKAENDIVKVSSTGIRHDCDHCWGIKSAFVAGLDVELGALWRIVEVEWRVAEMKLPLGEFYYSVDRSEFAKGSCPNLSYAITVNVVDHNGDPLQCVEVSDSTGKNWGETNISGNAFGYLKNGTATITVNIAGAILNKDIEVKGEPQKVVITIPESYNDAVNEATAQKRFEDLLEQLDPEIKEQFKDIGKVIATGTCGEQGDNIMWALSAGGGLQLAGTGRMKDYEMPFEAYTTKITSVEIGSGITHIGGLAFSDCSRMTAITIPDSVTSIGSRAFCRCFNLNNITLPAGLTNIGSGAFDNCQSLKHITIVDGITSVGADLFYNCFGLKSITLPDTVTLIGDNAFYGCLSLTEIVLPSGVKKIGYEAFADCSKLTDITIPAAVTEIGFEAFSGCRRLTSIKFEGDAPTIGSDIFYSVTATVYYPAGNATWTADVMQNYGGTITWVPYTPEDATVAEETGTYSMTASVKRTQAKAVFGGEYETEVLDEYILKTASFSGLTPGVQYTFLSLASIDVEDVLTANNLLYIDLVEAGENGKLAFQYVQRINRDPSYVLLCGPSDWDVNDAVITFPEMEADGQLQVVNPTVTYDGKTLVEGVDYVISGEVYYAFAGEYTITIEGIYDYTGSVDCTYTVGGKVQERPAFKSASLALQHNLAVDYKVDKTVMDESGYTDLYAVFKIGDVERTITDYTVSDDRYVFRLNDIAPHKMNDSIYATLYGTYDGKVYASEVREYSIATYCYNMLGKSTDTKLLTMLVDLLNYGTVSQKYVGHNMDALVNEKLTEEQKQWATAELRSLGSVQDPAYEVVENPTATWKSASLTLSNAVEVRVKFAAGNIDGLSIKVRTDDEEWTVSADEFLGSDGVYYVDFDGLNAGQMRETLYVTICNGDTPVSNTLRYSIETYAGKKQNVTEGYLGELMVAMMKYGDSAYIYGGGTFPAAVVASGECGTNGDNVLWKLYDDGLLKLTGSGEMAEYTYSSPAPWFDYAASILTVDIDSGITNIGSYALYNCTALTDIKIPEGVTSIGYSAFENCSSLASITLSDNLTSIGQSAFYCCTSLTNIILPEGITTMGYRAFGKSGLTSITIPDSVTSIGGEAFYMCSGMTAIVVGSGNANYSSDSQGILYNKDQTKVVGAVGSVVSVTIPGGVTSLETGAFNGCTSLISITFEGDAPTIGSDAFRKVTATAYYPEDNTTWTSEVMQNYGGTITWEAYGVVRIVASGECGAEGDNILWTLDENGLLKLTGTGETMYCNSSNDIPWQPYRANIKSVEISEGITSLRHFTFMYCWNLTSVTIPNSVTYIGNYTFYTCTSLTSITLPDSVRYIGAQAFMDSTALTSIAIPDSVTRIGDYAFSGCTKLSNVTLSNSLTSIGGYVFEGCKSLTSITLPDSVTKIGTYAFYQCTGLTSIDLSNNLASIGTYAFRECSSLANVTLPSSMTQIGDYAFFLCTGLTSITFEGDAPTIGSGAFYNVTATAYYPADNTTWTSDVMQNYGGTITWEAVSENGDEGSGELSGDDDLPIAPPSAWN